MLKATSQSLSSHAANSATTCACEPCNCTVNPETAVSKNGKLYCSEACANGHANGNGCGCSGCNCGS